MKSPRSLLRITVLFSLCFASVSGLAQTSGRIDFPAPSPAAQVRQRVGLTDFEVVYSRPSVKDRRIFGELEPYGEVWRTGANAATKISFSTAVTFGGQLVEAGTYALFSIPGESEWIVILNRQAEQW